MASIEGIRIKNYRVLRDITLGRLWNTPHIAPLTPMTAVIGKNGVGKSSLFDAFGFLADCLKLGVEVACDERGRGGFDRIRSQGSNEPIRFEIRYSRDMETDPITYELEINRDESGRPYAQWELLHASAPWSTLQLSSIERWRRRGMERRSARATYKRGRGRRD